MRRFWLSFGDVRRSNPSICAARNAWVHGVLMKDKDWLQDFNRWEPDGSDWGIVKSENTEGDLPASLAGLMAKHNFRLEKREYGDWYHLEKQVELPKEFETVRATTDMDCVICFETIAIHTELVVLPCNHEFHRECIMAWLALSVKCAHCRQSCIDIEKRLQSVMRKGNAAAKRGEDKEALERYTKCLSGECPSGKYRVPPRMRMRLHLNIALIHLRTGSPEEAQEVLHHATRALASTEARAQDKAKACYRIGRAYELLNDARAALENFSKAYEYDPDDTAILKAKTRLAHKIDVDE